MSFTGPIEDRLAVRELHGAYADAAFRNDMQAWLDCWTDDCVWVTPFGEVRGKAEMAEQWGKIADTFGFVAFFAIVGAIELDGERGISRGYVREIATMAEGALYKVVGRYDDEVRRENGTWRFARRAYTALIREDGKALA